LEDFLSLVSGNNISVARAADRILRIEDGVIKMALTPTEAIAEEKAVSYIDQIRARITEIEEELLQLDEDFKTGKSVETSTWKKDRGSNKLEIAFVKNCIEWA